MKKFKPTKRIYLASPYSALKCKNKRTAALIRDERYAAVTIAAAKLQDKYPYAFILPITQSHNTSPYMKNKNTGFAAWKQIDLTFVECCDEVWVLDLPGWDESIGVQEEMAFAAENDIAIKFVDHKTYKVKPFTIKTILNNIEVK